MNSIDVVRVIKNLSLVYKKKKKIHSKELQWKEMNEI